MASFALNGQVTSWQNIEVSFDPFVPLIPTAVPPLAPMKLPTISAIDYKLSIERQAVYGAGPNMIGYSLGRIKPETAKFTIGEADWVSFMNNIGGTAGLYITQFNITIQYIIDRGATVDTDVLQGCLVKSFSKSRKEGPEGQMVEVELDVVSIQVTNPLLGATNVPTF